MNLSLLIDVHAPELVRRLAGTPDVGTLLRRLQALLEHEPPPPYFARLPLERFLNAVQQLEEGMLTYMTWETEPDPVARAHGRARLRQALSKLVHEYSSGVDQEVTRLVRVEAQQVEQLSEVQALLSGMLDLSGEGWMGLDQHFRVRFVSPGALTLLTQAGLLSEGAPGVEGLPLATWIPPLAALVELAGQSSAEGVWTHTTPEGEVRQLSWRWAPLQLKRVPVGEGGLRSLLVISRPSFSDAC